jgi:hypothetical protein
MIKCAKYGCANVFSISYNTHHHEKVEPPVEFHIRRQKLATAITFLLTKCNVAFTITGAIVIIPLTAAAGDKLFHIRTTLALSVLRPVPNTQTYRVMGPARIPGTELVGDDTQEHETVIFS